MIDLAKPVAAVVAAEKPFVRVVNNIMIAASVEWI